MTHAPARPPRLLTLRALCSHLSSSSAMALMCRDAEAAAVRSLARCVAATAGASDRSGPDSGAVGGGGGGQEDAGGRHAWSMCQRAGRGVTCCSGVAWREAVGAGERPCGCACLGNYLFGNCCMRHGVRGHNPRPGR